MSETRTLIYIDGVSFGGRAHLINEMVGPKAVNSFINTRIDTCIEAALTELGKRREDVENKTPEGDDFRGEFYSAEEAHIFAKKIHQEADKYNYTRDLEEAKIWFRAAVVTAKIDDDYGDLYYKAPRQPVGDALTRLSRLLKSEKAKPGGLLIDDETFRILPPAIQREYSLPEETYDKDERLFIVRQWKSPYTKNFVSGIESNKVARELTNIYPDDFPFIGREKDLDKIHEKIEQANSSGNVVRLVVTGMSGIGKTALARKYALDHKHEYPGGTYEISENIEDKIFRIARIDLGLDYLDHLTDPVEKLEYCWKNWGPEGDVLIVLDNVENYSAIRKYLPKNSRFKIILTSTSSQVQLSSSIRLDLLERKDSIKLLKSSINSQSDLSEKSQELIDDICDLLDDFPIAIFLVGRYISEYGFTLEETFHDLMERGVKSSAFQMSGQEERHKNLNSILENLIWTGLEEDTKLLCMWLAFFSPSLIPWALVKETKQMKSKNSNKITFHLKGRSLSRKDSISPFEEYDEDELYQIFNCSRDCLISLGFLQQVDAGIYRVHKLLHGFFRFKLESHKKSKDLGRYFCRKISSFAKDSWDEEGNISYVSAAISKPHVEEVIRTWDKFASQDSLRFASLYLLDFFTLFSAIKEPSEYVKSNSLEETKIAYWKEKGWIGKDELDQELEKTLDDIFRRSNSPFELAFLYKRLGFYFLEKEEIEKSEKFFLKSLFFSLRALNFLGINISTPQGVLLFAWFPLTIVIKFSAVFASIESAIESTDICSMLFYVLLFLASIWFIKVYSFLLFTKLEINRKTSNIEDIIDADTFNSLSEKKYLTLLHKTLRSISTPLLVNRRLKNMKPLVIEEITDAMEGLLIIYGQQGECEQVEYISPFLLSALIAVRGESHIKVANYFYFLGLFFLYRKDELDLSSTCLKSALSIYKVHENSEMIEEVNDQLKFIEEKISLA